MIDYDNLKILLEKLFFKNITEDAINVFFSIENNSDINFTLESDYAPQYTSNDMEFFNELMKDGIIKNISISEYPGRVMYNGYTKNITRVKSFKINIIFPIKNTAKLIFLLKVSV